MTYLSDSIVKLFCVVVYGAVRIISQISHSVGLFPMLQNVLAFNRPVIVNDFMTGLTWGRNFYPHTHTHGDPHGDPHTYGRAALWGCSHWSRAWAECQHITRSHGSARVL